MRPESKCSALASKYSSIIDCTTEHVKSSKVGSVPSWPCVGQAMVPSPELPSPSDCGWEMDDEVLKPLCLKLPNTYRE